MNKKIFTRTIWILSIVSLLMDFSSEMLYPIMPLYLKSIGFSILLIGIFEGLADSIAGLSKGYFGKLSDLAGSRVPFVRWGYLLSAVSKPMMGMFINPLWIFASRTMDRFGKGIRTSARDAILSEESSPENKAKVFGFHRSMDTLGAVIGPLAALIYLNFYPENYRTLFFIAFVPAITGVLFTLILKDKNAEPIRKFPKTSFFSFLAYWRVAGIEYKKLVIGLLFFSLLNSSDFFLLLMLKNLGYDDKTIILIYIFYNFIFAISSLPVGIVADKIGLKNNYVTGLILFAFVYFCMALQPGIKFIFFIFFCYGIFAASTEGISRAWITNIAEKKNAATAIGFYTGLSSICTFFSSSFAGWLWYSYSPYTMFIFSATGTIFVVLYFFIVFRKRKLLV